MTNALLADLSAAFGCSLPPWAAIASAASDLKTKLRGHTYSDTCILGGPYATF
jgi:hypothetical protein